MEYFISLLLVIGVVAIFVCSQQYARRILYRYKVTKQGITVRLYGLFPVWKIKFEEIVEIKKISLPELGIRELINCRNLRNRLWGHTVVIKQKGGFFNLRNVAITPDDPDGFISEINLLKAGIEGD